MSTFEITVNNCEVTVEAISEQEQNEKQSIHFAQTCYVDSLSTEYSESTKSIKLQLLPLRKKDRTYVCLLKRKPHMLGIKRIKTFRTTK